MINFDIKEINNTDYLNNIGNEILDKTGLRRVADSLAYDIEEDIAGQYDIHQNGCLYEEYELVVDGEIDNMLSYKLTDEERKYVNTLFYKNNLILNCKRNYDTSQYWEIIFGSKSLNGDDISICISVKPKNSYQKAELVNFEMSYR
jgi:hypothetical protein